MDAAYGLWSSSFPMPCTLNSPGIEQNYKSNRQYSKLWYWKQFGYGFGICRLLIFQFILPKEFLKRPHYAIAKRFLMALGMSFLEW